MVTIDHLQQHRKHIVPSNAFNYAVHIESTALDEIGLKLKLLWLLNSKGDKGINRERFFQVIATQYDRLSDVHVPHQFFSRFHYHCLCKAESAPRGCVCVSPMRELN